MLSFQVAGNGLRPVAVAFVPSSRTKPTTTWTWSLPPFDSPWRTATQRQDALSVAGSAKPIPATNSSQMCAHGRAHRRARGPRATAVAGRGDRRGARAHGRAQSGDPRLLHADVRALRRGAADEAELMSGSDLGSLAEVPVAVKDLFGIAGVRTAAGSWAYPGVVADETSAACACPTARTWATRRTSPMRCSAARPPAIACGASCATTTFFWTGVYREFVRKPG